VVIGAVAVCQAFPGVSGCASNPIGGQAHEGGDPSESNEPHRCSENIALDNPGRLQLSRSGSRSLA
jgi:hypothetical protein